jgi:hypothetical protein
MITKFKSNPNPRKKNHRFGWFVAEGLITKAYNDQWNGMPADQRVAIIAWEKMYYNNIPF